MTTDLQTKLAAAEARIAELALEVLSAQTQAAEHWDRIKELEKDAARLKWLLNNDSEMGVYLMYDCDDYRYVHSDEALELIDAALEQKEIGE